jgi:hypothetical protein
MGNELLCSCIDTSRELYSETIHIVREKICSVVMLRISEVMK